jgi:hypothetical protein
MSNFIVLRASPDWKRFDIEISRAFCRRLGLPETTIIDFVEVWDRHLRVDYRTFRHSVKKIAVSTFARVRDATVLGSVDELTLADVGDDGLIAFTDDDDWFSPDIFGLPANSHGVYWGSSRLGRPLGSTFAQGHGGMLTLREIEPFLYTNNYIMTGRALREFGPGRLLEHGNAQQCLQEGRFKPLEDRSYASCANKSPASAVSANYLLSLEEFRADPLTEFRSYRSLLNRVEIPERVAWMRRPFTEYRALVNDAMPAE